MSIENGVFNSCTPAECYVSKQVASWVKLEKAYAKWMSAE